MTRSSRRSLHEESTQYAVKALSSGLSTIVNRQLAMASLHGPYPDFSLWQYQNAEAERSQGEFLTSLLTCLAFTAAADWPRR